MSTQLLLLGADTPTPRLCLCGCGTPLKSPSSNYAPGHYARSEAARARLVQRNLQVAAPMVPWNQLQTRCLKYIELLNLDGATFARQAGIKRHTFQRWFKQQGSAINRSALDALAMFFEIPNEVAVNEAGGVTAEDRWRGSARAMRAERERRLGPRPAAVADKCAICDRPIRISAGDQKRRGMALARACSKVHAYRLLRKHSGWCRLQRRIFQYIDQRDLTVPEFSRLAGVPAYVLRHWIRRKDSTISESSLRALASFFDVPEKQAVDEAGGVTAEVRQRSLGSAVAPLGLPLSNTASARQKRAESHRGRKRSPEWVRAITEGLRASPLAQAERVRSAARLGAFRNSLEGKMVHFLWRFLEKHPKPTAEQLAQRAEEAATRLDTKSALVRAAWRPYLQKRDAVAKGGRPRAPKRAGIIRELMTTWPRKKDGDLSDGFWSIAARRVLELEGGSAPFETKVIDDTAGNLRRWWLRHPEVRL